MIQIAICDDDMTTTSQIEEYIRQIEIEQHIQVQYRIFFDGKSFMQSVESGEAYDLIYLDVEMPLMKGLDAAKKLREMEISSLIIYISNYETYCESMIETEPFRFLRKPINDVDLFRKYFMSAYKKLENRNEYYTYSYKKIHHKININDIMYFESNNRKYVYIQMEIKKTIHFMVNWIRLKRSWNLNHVHLFGFISLIW